MVGAVAAHELCWCVQILAGYQILNLIYSVENKRTKQILTHKLRRLGNVLSQASVLSLVPMDFFCTHTCVPCCKSRFGTFSCNASMVLFSSDCRMQEISTKEWNRSKRNTRYDTQLGRFTWESLLMCDPSWYILFMHDATYYQCEV